MVLHLTFSGSRRHVEDLGSGICDRSGHLRDDEGDQVCLSQDKRSTADSSSYETARNLLRLCAPALRAPSVVRPSSTSALSNPGEMCQDPLTARYGARATMCQSSSSQAFRESCVTSTLDHASGRNFEEAYRPRQFMGYPTPDLESMTGDTSTCDPRTLESTCDVSRGDVSSPATPLPSSAWDGAAHDLSLYSLPLLPSWTES